MSRPGKWPAGHRPSFLAGSPRDRDLLKLREGPRPRVVDLVGETGSEGAEGHQGFPLPGCHLNGPGGAVQPLEEMPAEWEPGADLLS